MKVVVPLEFFEGVTMEAGSARTLKTEWMGGTHYNYRIVRCPPKLSYDGTFTQVFDGGFDYITSTITAADDAEPREYIVVVEWGWSEQPITFGKIMYTLRLRFEVRVTPGLG